jgi:hypothetical protein
VSWAGLAYLWKASSALDAIDEELRRSFHPAQDWSGINAQPDDRGH